MAAGWEGKHWVGAGPGASASVCGPGTALSPGLTLPFLVKKQTDLTLKNKETNEWGWEKKTQLSGFIIKNRLIKFETEYNVGSFFVFCGFLRFFYTSLVQSPTSNKDMPTMFHYTATVTHYPQRGGNCCPMRRGLHRFGDKQCHCVWRRREN